MCGIAGIFHFEPERSADARLLDRMTDVLAHRGPDGRGVHLDGALGLGHRRLAIIDLSPDAAQPLANEDGSVQVMLNGEIYNFRSLRDELIGKGHRFRSRGDSEVLVHLYEEEGPRLVERLRGMFALVLWDARRRRLVLARDRFGQKPLYYRLTEKSLHFASEIKGILEDPEVPRRPDPLAIDAYLTYGYVPAPATAFAGIRKLPPAHRLTVEADGRSALDRYWRLHFTPKEPSRPTTAARQRAERQVMELIDESTRLRMISDVSLGAFLSGGIDSSAVVASMCAAADSGDGSVATFSIGFAEKGSDESPYAAEVARHLGTDHRRLLLTRGALADLDRIAWHYGEPFADSSCLPTFAVSGLARRHVTVALTGDGGDEVFGGYRRYLGMWLAEWAATAPVAARSAARQRILIELLRRGGRATLAAELARDARRREAPGADLYLSRIEALDALVKRRLYSQGFLRATADHDPRDLLRQAIAASDGETLAERCSHADLLTYLPDDILTKVDVASMAHGLECRAPFLDHVLAETVARLPFRLKLTAWDSKIALRGAVRRRLPRSILARSKKGFSIPLATWFGGGLEPLARETLTSQRARERGYFDPAGIDRLLAADRCADGAGGRELFTLLMLEIWHRLWIDPPRGEAIEAPPRAAVEVASR